MSYLFRSPFQFFQRFPGRSCMFLLIVAVLLLCMHGLFFVNGVLDHTSQIVKKRLTLTLYVRSEYSIESRNMRNFIEELEALDSPIRSTYITKEVALDQELQRNPDLLSILSGENPLPDSIILDVSPDNIE